MEISNVLLHADANGERMYGLPAELDGMPELELITRLRQGDHDAFAMMYRVFHPQLVAIAKGYVHSAAVAEELAQDTLLISWERCGQWRDDDSLIPYLYITVRNGARKHLRHERVIGRVEEAATAEGHLLGSSELRESVADVVENADMQAIVIRAVNRLPTMQHTAFLLRWVHKLDYSGLLMRSQQS